MPPCATCSSKSCAPSTAPQPRRRRRQSVILHGFSWIVEPVDGKVVIAIEIPMGAAVAGPFEIHQAELDARIARVLKADAEIASAPPSGRVH